MPPTFNAAPKCAGGCGECVYFAERTLGPGGKVFHKRCLKCMSCGKVLDSGSVQDHDGAPFCRPCHSKAFGTRGYGISHAGLVGEYQPRSSSDFSSPPTLSPSRPSPSSAVPSPAPASPAPPQPEMTDRTPLPAPTPPAASPAPSARVIPPPIPKKPSIPSKPAFAARTSVGGRTSFGGGGGVGENCPRCSQVVYAAEAVLASGSKWHKRCLRCAGCSTVLTGANLVEKSGEPWCAKCHTKNSLAEQGMMTRPGLF